MGKFIDLTGQRFGRLTVVEQTCKSKDGRVSWICKCDCGNYSIVRGKDLRNGNTKSCGCIHKEIAKSKATKHGLRYTRINGIWKDMKKRCYNENHSHFSHYGGRGITVCEEWMEFEPFYNWAMTNGYQDNLSIDRKDVNGNYEPSNCRWATNKEQANNKRYNRLLTYNGETRTMAEWSEITGIAYKTIQTRIDRYGWTVEKALTEPVKQYKNAIKAVNQ